jgi:quercetin dioxygenase-like cupin family protein
LRFPTRATNRQEITLHRGEVVFFDATLPHQVVNDSDERARLFISRNYDFDGDRGPADAGAAPTEEDG